jgi:hypothetical protein
MMPPDVEHGQNASTSDHLCACGCGEFVKPRQRWYTPACKARAYRVRQRAASPPSWDYIEEVEADRDHCFGQMLERSRKVEALEQAYSVLWEEHQHCRRAAPVSEPPRRWLGDAFAILGVRPDAEWAAIEGAYHGLAKKYHSDHHPNDPAAEARMKDITAAYAEVKRRRGKR